MFYTNNFSASNVLPLCRDFNLHLKSDWSLFHPDFKAVSISREGARPISGFDTRQFVRGHAGGEYKCIFCRHYSSFTDLQLQDQWLLDTWLTTTSVALFLLASK